MSAISVLLIDDDADTRKIFQILLDYYAFPLSTIGSGKEAQEYFQDYSSAYKPVFDVIAIRVMLPDVNSYQLAQQIRRSSRAKLVAITTRYTRLQPSEVEIGGDFDGLLLNPLQVSDLIPYLNLVVAGKISLYKSLPAGRRVTRWKLIDYPT